MNTRDSERTPSSLAALGSDMAVWLLYTLLPLFGLGFSLVSRMKHRSFNPINSFALSHESYKALDDYQNNWHIFSVSLPTGLLLTEVKSTDGLSNHYCLLNHNEIKLNPLYRPVHEIKDVLSKNMCNDIINKAEAYASVNGWTLTRHRAYPTTDLPLDLIFGKFNNIHGILTGMLGELEVLYQLREDTLRIKDLFVAKYQYAEGKQKDLKPHLDGTPFSFVIALNELYEYEGGGTRFTSSNTTYRCNVGSGILFSGKNEHEGVAITKGTRYILTGFCDVIKAKSASFQHEFLLDYNSLYDGNAGKQIQIGDKLIGVVCNDKFINTSNFTSQALKEVIHSSSSESIGNNCVKLVIDRGDQDSDVIDSKFLIATANYFSYDGEL